MAFERQGGEVVLELPYDPELSDGRAGLDTIGDAFGENFTGPGSLAGIKGTVALAEPRYWWFYDIDDVAPDLEHTDYAAEAYDPIAITTLATVIAGTDDSAPVARQINGTTRDGERCEEFAACVELIEGRRECGARLLGWRRPLMPNGNWRPTCVSLPSSTTAAVPTSRGGCRPTSWPG